MKNILLLLVFLVPSLADALPRNLLLSGARCATCHYSPAGGGIRTDLGWSSMSEVGMISYEQMGWDSLAEMEENSWWEERLVIGWDMRFQMAKKGVPTATTNPSRRVFFPMQVMPYAAVEITDWLKINADYNFGEGRYKGQAAYKAAVQIEPNPKVPRVRLGMLDPNIGLKHDDHTILSKGFAVDPKNPLIPPNWAEPGAEVYYDIISWITLGFAYYQPKNISEKVLYKKKVQKAGETMPTYQEVKPETDESIILARIEMMPQFLDLGLTAYLGGSFLENKKFRLENYFAGLGKEYMGTLIFEFARSTFSNREQRKLMMAQFSYDIFEWLVFESRYETGKRERDRDGESLEEKVSQMVFGFQYFPIPYLEIRPEYRYQKTEEYIMGYYAVQMHMFF